MRAANRGLASRAMSNADLEIHSVLDWWTHKRVFQFDLVKLGHWICTLMYTVCILKTWLVLETMLLANLNMFLWLAVLYIVWRGWPTVLEEIFNCCDDLAFKVVDRLLYHTILQHCKMLIMTEVKRRRRKYILCFVLLQTKSTWSLQGNSWSNHTPKVYMVFPG